MQQALDALANSKAYKGNITALLNDAGTAEYVVLNSDTVLNVDTEGDHGSSTSGDYTVTLRASADTAKYPAGLALTIATTVASPNEEAEWTLYSENLVTGKEQVEDNGTVTVNKARTDVLVAETSSNLLRYYVVVEVDGETLTTSPMIGG